MYPSYRGRPVSRAAAGSLGSTNLTPICSACSVSYARVSESENPSGLGERMLVSPRDFWIPACAGMTELSMAHPDGPKTRLP